MEPETIEQTLNYYKISNADFLDYLIADSNLFNGCHESVICNKKAGSQPLFKLL